MEAVVYTNTKWSWSCEIWLFERLIWHMGNES